MPDPVLGAMDMVAKTENSPRAHGSQEARQGSRYFQWDLVFARVGAHDKVLRQLFQLGGILMKPKTKLSTLLSVLVRTVKIRFA